MALQSARELAVQAEVRCWPLWRDREGALKHCWKQVRQPPLAARLILNALAAWRWAPLALAQAVALQPDPVALARPAMMEQAIPVEEQFDLWVLWGCLAWLAMLVAAAFHFLALPWMLTRWGDPSPGWHCAEQSMKLAEAHRLACSTPMTPSLAAQMPPQNRGQGQERRD